MNEDDFRRWQLRFYNSKRWRKIRNRVREREQMRCQMCHRFIKGKSIVDHIIEITPFNKDDTDITLNEDNLQLLCVECHNTKTFGGYTGRRGQVKDSGIVFDIEQREDINLF